MTGALASDGFGHWLAGLIDGEGCFTITPNRPGFLCRLTVSLREDDAAVLMMIANRTGIGGIRRSAPPSRAVGNRRPQVHWRVQKKDECRVLVAILDAFPLRAKKARDYALWREAVLEMAAMVGGVNRHTGPRDWSRIAELKERLGRVRDEGRDLQHEGMARDQPRRDRARSEPLHRR